MIDKHLQKLQQLSDDEIGTGYFTEEELSRYISSEHTFWRFATTKEDSDDKNIELKNTSNLKDSETIIGFIWGRVIPVRVFTDTRFSLPKIYSDEKVVFEVPTWVVQEDYQDYSIGSALIGEMTEVIIESEVYPVISPVRKSEDKANDHLFFLSQYGHKIEILPDKPTDVTCAICGDGCTCQTVILKYSEDEITQLNQDCSK